MSLWRFARWATLAAVFALAAGCSDDDAAGGEGADTGSGADATSDVPDFANPDGADPDAFDPGGTKDGSSDADDAAGGGDAADTEDDIDTTPPPPTCDDCQAPKVCVDGYCVDPAPGGCEPDSVLGCEGETILVTCDATGTAWLPIPCGANTKCMDGECKPLLCVPETWVCEGIVMHKQCSEDGTAFKAAEPCDDGLYCTGGKCGSSCQLDPKYGAYVGCDFWSVDLPNYPDPFSNPTPEDLPYAIVVSNPSDLDAEVSFEMPTGWTLDLDDNVVPGNSSVPFFMPPINVQHSGVFEAGIRMTSTRPVLVHQFNPWDNEFSNDASLLLPENLLGSEYVILTWPTSPIGLFPIPGFPSESQNGYFTVLAIYDNTNVTFTVTAYVKANGIVPEMKAGDTHTVTLAKGQVVNVEAEPKGLFDPLDLSGSVVTADKPVAVWGGHEEAVIGNGEPESDPCCADHMEEQFFPKSVLGQSYLAIKSKPRVSSGSGGTVEPDYWRIQAAEPNVTITTVPPIAGVSGKTLAKTGDWVEAVTNQSFEVTATGKIQVVQYLISQTDTEQYTGDPSMIVAVPTERFRKSYVMNAPPLEDLFGKQQHWITVVKPPTAEIIVDGNPVPQAQYLAMGSGAWEYTYVGLAPGIHRIEGDEAFGLSAYGYNNAVSYGYPGGLSAPGE
jgi:hypothetical protein